MEAIASSSSAQTPTKATERSTPERWHLRLEVQWEPEQSELLTIVQNGDTVPPAVVAIGSAAMELSVIAQTLAALPKNLPAAVLVALHSVQPVNGPALLRALAKVSALPCAWAVDQEFLAEGHVYLAPADKHLLVQGDHLRVVFGPKENGHRPALDALFRTAAHEWGPRAVGVVLCGISGEITDGLSGLWQIKESGGTVVMPHAEGSGPVAEGAGAIFHRVAADYSPSPAELPSLLFKLASERNHLVS